MNHTVVNTSMQTIARKAGALLLHAGGRQSTRKGNIKDFVTVTDIKAQNIIEQELNRLFPTITALSEEHPAQARKQMFAPNFTGFVIDPIDGTYNFKRDMRESAVSIGYVEKGETVTGVVYDPYKDEMYSAIRSEGAFRNGVAIHVSAQSDIAGASIATSNSYDDAAMARNLKRHLAIYEQTGAMPWTNCPGSGVLIMAYVACGRFDAYHHNGLKPWDNAAAFLIIREAGGRVLQLDGAEAPFTSPTVLAGNPALTAKLQDIFKKLDSQLLR